MQFPGAGKPPVGVIFDADTGAGIDQALALALLYGLDGKNECRVAALTSSNPALESAQYMDAVGRFYAGAVSAAFAAVGRQLPVALATEGPAIKSPMLLGPLSLKKPDGTLVHFHNVQRMLDTAEPRAVIRNALTAQFDENAVIVCAGRATNIAAALALPGFKPWAAQKVRQLVMTEHGLATDIPAARAVLATWPGPVVIVPDAASASTPYPAASIEKDFAWSTAHPVVDAYRAYKPMPYDAPSWSLAAVLYAVRAKEGYFKLSEPGTASLSADGKLTFAATANGPHRQLLADASQQARVLEAYTTLVSAKPVPRAPRFRPPAQKVEEKKAEPVRPATP